jgi:translation initiation factor 2 gamma subunit (eIF-2gamma)
LGHPGTLPDVFDTVEVNYSLLRRLLGVKQQESGKGAEENRKKIENLKNGGWDTLLKLH